MIAAALHIDDGSPLIAWAYAQELGAVETMRARIEIWGAGAVPDAA
jgi:hypothetical protein